MFAKPDEQSADEKATIGCEMKPTGKFDITHKYWNAFWFWAGIVWIIIVYTIIAKACGVF